ncbi:MAG: amidohydrolase [bacterium]|nr:amidohydrolase [bacterium]
MRSGPALVALVLLLPAAALGESVADAVARDYDRHLEPLFEHFHRNPELSYLEFETSKRLAKELRSAGAEVTQGVGGTGVVGVLANGPGPRVLIRADMDGLPIREDSGLDFASTATQERQDGEVVPVMHACGHDMHMTSLVGSARWLAKHRDAWSGTIVFVGQPAEERIGGAKAMLADGLYDRFGVPDFALGLHVHSGGPTGRVVLHEGASAASSDSIDLMVFGAQAHGAAPQNGKDAVYVAAQIVVALQSLVSREISPIDNAVVTVGSIHGGVKHNIIADEVKLELTVRSDAVRVRDHLIEGIERIARGVARTHGVSDDRLPTLEILASTPPVVNDDALIARLRAPILAELGPDGLYTRTRDSMGAEDFAEYGSTEHDVPSAFLSVGGSPPEAVEAADAGGPPLPFHHSPGFRIEPRGSVTTGVRATVAAVKELLPPPE